ncbi:MAG: threonylcarbamoyl-AMP synthase [Clostridia bacterium]|nr:threonylcarbamoyl-AMP synthase [Clostridia bacterium]
MNTEYYKITADESANAKIFAHGGEIIRAGGLVAFPTETVYGLGGNALNADAAAKIYAAKGRPSDNPLIIHISRVEDADRYCVVNDVYLRLANAFMPGPLTVVMPKRDCIPLTVTGGLDTVAVRIPSDFNARRLIEAAGVPIAAPSANRSGKPSPTAAEHVREDLDGRIDMVIDGGRSDIGVESTIVKIDGERLILLRPGGITLEMLEEVCPNVTIDKAVLHQLKSGERPQAPGMMYRHYAPDTKVVLLDGSDEAFYAYIAKQALSDNVGALIFDDDREHLPSNVVTLSLGKRNAADEARALFDRLRQIDLSRCNVFYARLPDKTGLGLAVYNRILKASGYNIVKL